MRRTTTNLASMVSQPQPTDPPPALQACRHSVDSDLPRIEALQTPLTKVMFGEVDIRICIEKCVCKTLVNVHSEIVAFLVVMDHPNIPTLTHCNWSSWIRRHYRVDFATPWNTLFIHYLVWDFRYPTFFLSFLKTLYKNNTKLEQIFMVTPPKLLLFPELESFFTTVYPSSEGIVSSTFSNFQNLHLNLRHHIISKLTIRKAAEEDNIDVQPLVHQQREVLNYVFGEFKLGNVIDIKTPSKAVLVAQKGNSVTVGVLSLSSKVDYNHVNLFFHHILDTTRRTSLMARQDTVKSDFRRGLPFTSDTLSVEDDQLSIDLNAEKRQTVEEESVEEDEDHDERVVYWDVDGDTFRVVDPVKEYLLNTKEKGTVEPELESEEGRRRESSLSHQSVDNPYWGRPSWSMSFVPLIRGESISRNRVGTLSTKDNQQTASYIPLDNAFIITLLALHPDLDIRYAFDLLEASFECFTDKHFCLLYLPTAYQGSPLIQHMVRMAPIMSWDFPHELYVTHRNATFSEFKVRPVTIADHIGINELVESISQGKKISKAITKILLQESPGTKGFILECEGNIVGVTVITNNFGLHQLQPHYKVEKLIQLRLYDQESHGLIRHLVLCPIFLKSGPFFLRQIMHQAGLETLSYFMLHADIINTFHIDISSITILGDMIPVRPRRQIHYDLSALDVFKPLEQTVRLDYDFALFIVSEKLLSIPKLELNYRIVVVGGSNTAMSFLENLIFKSAQKYVKYNNVMLVSIHGFPLELNAHISGDKMIPHNGRYTREYLSRISLSSHVNVLYGALTVINRKEKMVCLNEDHWLRYDYLFLFTGMQFCKPWPSFDFPRHWSTGQTTSHQTDSVSSCLKDDRDFQQQDCRKNDDIREQFSHVSQLYGDNLFVINTTTDAVVALSHLKNAFKRKKDGKILIHGHGLHPYTCVESLLVFGVPAHKIALVMAPHSNLSHRCLETNSFIENTILHTMEEAGVTIYKGYSLICWSLKHKCIDRVMFRDSNNIPLTLDCIALFCYGSKSTSAKTYMAVNDAGIVFNNGIIINNRFRTNDDYIYAAGPGTRYSNRYNTTEFSHHRYYSSVEIGRQMSKIFRRLVEPSEDYKPFKTPPTTPSQLLMKKNHSFYSEKPASTTEPENLLHLCEPITLVAQLPGGWNFIKVAAPGRPLPLECQFSGQGDSGPILITGVPILPDGPGYFQLSFTIYNTVHEIVLLSKKEIPYQNLMQLYGKHERMLNNLYEYYNQGLISDFYEFFSQPWAYAMYTEGFNKLARQCGDILVSNDSVGIPTLLPQEIQDFDTTLHKLCMEHEAIGSRYLSSSVPMYAEHLTLKFISERPLQLPMYYTDSVLSSWHQSPLSNSPLHRDPAKVHQKSKASTQQES